MKKSVIFPCSKISKMVLTLRPGELWLRPHFVICGPACIFQVTCGSDHMWWNVLQIIVSLFFDFIFSNQLPLLHSPATQPRHKQTTTHLYISTNNPKPYTFCVAQTTFCVAQTTFCVAQALNNHQHQHRLTFTLFCY